MSKKSLILSIPILVLAVLLGGWLVVRRSAPVSGPAPTPASSTVPVLPSLQPPTIGGDSAQMKPVDFAKYNKTLSRNKVTGVTDLEGPYKKVTVSNGVITFSFEVPDKWLTETRNSGEVQMNEEELRDFLGTKWDGDIRSGKVCGDAKIFDAEVGDFVMKETCSYPVGNYWDFTWDMLKNMSFGDMKGYYNKRRDEFSPGFPNATVSSGMKQAIWYTDTGWDQVNFYVVNKQEGIRYLENGKKSLARHLQNQEPELRKKIETKWGNQIVGGRKALVALYSMDITEEGEYFVSKGGTGGREYFIEVNDTSTLILQKEAYVEGEFEEGFKHLIDTLSFD